MRQALLFWFMVFFWLGYMQEVEIFYRRLCFLNFLWIDLVHWWEFLHNNLSKYYFKPIPFWYYQLYILNYRKYFFLNINYRFWINYVTSSFFSSRKLTWLIGLPQHIYNPPTSLVLCKFVKKLLNIIWQSDEPHQFFESDKWTG